MDRVRKGLWVFPGVIATLLCALSAIFVIQIGQPSRLIIVLGIAVLAIPLAFAGGSQSRFEGP